jgi:ubiquitin conjugation factor E4 B
MHHLVTDATYLLDDAMLRLARLADHDRAVADSAAWGALPAAAREEREAAARADAQAVPGYLDLASSCIATIGFTTADPATAAPWLSRAMLGRTAEAVDYFLKHLAGPGRRGLKVADPEALHWRPKAMLASLAAVYVNLARAAAASGGAAGTRCLAGALAADARSFSPDLLPAAAEVLAAFNLLPEADLDALAGLADAAAAARAGGGGGGGGGGPGGAPGGAGGEEGPKAPDEFCDPVTLDLMDDPVMLPASRQVLDRSCVERLLLSDACDPFNKAPLAMEDVVEQPELRARIDAWKKEHGVV